VRLEVRTRYTSSIVGPLLTRHDLVMVCESEVESRMLDQAFGDRVVDGTGLIKEALCQCEVRLSDGYGKHYLAVQVPK
jgi:hypothetical protein